MAQGLLDDVGDLPEDADDVVARDERHRAELDRDAIAFVVDDHDRGVGDLGGGEDLAGEQLPRATRLLGRNDRGELAADDVADEARLRPGSPSE